MTTDQPAPPHAPVAIIGMGCRLPGGVNSPDQLWKTLIEGRDCLSRIPQERWELMVERLHPDQVPEHPFAAGIVDHAFDHAYFGISADEAAEMDPQQGWLLEVAHEALADAALDPAELAGTRTGVYVGAASIDQAATNFGARARAGVFTASGAGMAILANRLSHHLDLAGPSLTLDTACSSSLTALHYAVRDLRSGEVEAALVGGTNVLTNPVITASFTETGVLSSRGRCAPFDHNADGYVRSEGAVVLVLTRTGEATTRGHRIWARVTGTGIGHGGKTPHLLAPRADRQAQAIQRALDDAGIRPGQVGWVQAHGTGTKAGDRIEARGIAQALGEGGPVAVGSVKSVLGHLEGAAGALGVMAAALAVHHGQAPPTLHHHQLRAGLEHQVRVPVRAEPWPHTSQVNGGRVAGVSGFGFGGSNAHAILTQAPATDPPSVEDPTPLPETVFISAHSPAALASAAGRLAVNAPRGGSVGTAADTSLTRGPHHRWRAAVTATDLGTLVQGLRSLQDGTPDPYTITPRLTLGQRPLVVFVYSGHGGHHPHAGTELMYRPVFAQSVEEARAALAQQTGSPVWAPGQDITGFTDAQHCTHLIQVGLTALLADRGINPDLVLGHSVGEIAAAHTAQILDTGAAARVLARRSELLAQLTEAGGLLAVRARADEVQALLGPYLGRLTIASYSAPNVQVIAGPEEDLGHLHTHLEKEGVWCKPVPDVIPAHSPLIDPLAPALREALAGLVSAPPRLPIVSTADPDHTAGHPHTWGPAYWADQARQPVRFTQALHTTASAMGQRPVVFVEIGPKVLLAEHITHTLTDVAVTAVTSDSFGFARGIGQLYTTGITPTGPTTRAHPDLVIAPGWDHTRSGSTTTDQPRALTPARDQVQAHLTEEVARLADLPEGLDLDSTWARVGLGSHNLLQLISRLRRVPAWAQVDIQLFLSEQTFRQVASTLSELLPGPNEPALEGVPSVLP
ncbi:type I polyketide synthase [Nocardiopsis exhalans]|uniref:Type I polyketide synthase n=1 Tax=Nocardiopsis exhalans TaxID=163604 RepID=A0ABY5D8M8_9ACTN|nr:type I polyketide synthase [Nocardiopsis exhalans]USY20701.1 type I polyketide synthase [Nocardiopsis exhalans]